MVDPALRRGELQALEGNLSELLALLTRDPAEPWSRHFAPLRERAAALRGGPWTQEDLTRLSVDVMSYFHARDSGFDLWLATSTIDGVQEAASRVASSALALRFVGDV